MQNGWCQIGLYTHWFANTFQPEGKQAHGIDNSFYEGLCSRSQHATQPYAHVRVFGRLTHYSLTVIQGVMNQYVRVCVLFPRCSGIIAHAILCSRWGANILTYGLLQNQISASDCAYQHVIGIQ